MIPVAIRTMRAALGWSLRDLAAHSGLALNTVHAAESGSVVARKTERALRTALRVHGVTCRRSGDTVHVQIRQTGPSLRLRVAEELAGLPYVTLRGPREDGTYRVLFEVPARLRPQGWPPTRPLPVSARRRGDLTDQAEVAAIRSDAERFATALSSVRSISGP
jgi:transcriptional regulator with XRE-family HTH domain